MSMATNGCFNDLGIRMIVANNKRFVIIGGQAGAISSPVHTYIENCQALLPNNTIHSLAMNHHPNGQCKGGTMIAAFRVREEVLILILHGAVLMAAT